MQNREREAKSERDRVCVCVRERERQTDRQTHRHMDRDIKRWRLEKVGIGLRVGAVVLELVSSVVLISRCNILFLNCGNLRLSQNLRISCRRAEIFGRKKTQTAECRNFRSPALR